MFMSTGRPHPAEKNSPNGSSQRNQYLADHLHMGLLQPGRHKRHICGLPDNSPVGYELGSPSSTCNCTFYSECHSAECDKHNSLS